MNENGTIAPVVVGVDGSKHAVRAAIWAIDEAVRRGAPLRLVHVVRGDSGQDFAEARKIIHRAWAAVEATGIAVELESDIRQGDTVPELIEASRAAAMICVGSSRRAQAQDLSPAGPRAWHDRRRGGARRALPGRDHPAQASAWADDGTQVGCCGA